MKKISILFLQMVVVLIGVAGLYLLLWEPHIEGRNAHATLFEIYFKDPFLVYAYLGSIPFFVALYQAFKMLKYVRNNETFSPAAVKALRIIKDCASVIVAFVVAGEAYLFIVRPGDDIAGGVFMGLLVIAVSGVSAIVAKKFEKILRAQITK